MKKTLFILLSLFLGMIYGQDLTLFNLTYSPQSMQYNVSAFPKHNWYASLPVASSLNFGITNSFALSDALVNGPTGTALNLSGITDAVDNTGFFNFRTTLDILNFGVKFGDHFGGLTFQENIDVRVGYNNGLFNLAQYGFADSLVRGQAVTITGIGANIYHYSKASINYALKLEDGISVGVRPSIYFGKGYVNTLDTRLSLYLSEDVSSFRLDADVIAKISGTDLLDNIIMNDSTASSNFNAGNYMGNFRDKGFGVDLGITYPIDPSVTLTLAIIDLGFIRWKTTPRQYSIRDFEVGLNGLSLAELTGSGNNSDSTSQGGLDSLINSIEEQLVITSNENAFTTLLNTKFYINAAWHLNDQIDFGFLIRSQSVYGKMEQALTISNTYKVAKWLNASLTYTIANGTYNNAGLGFATNMGPVQFYLVSDNLLGLSQIDYTRQLNVRFGFNIRPKPKTIGPRWRAR